MAKNVKYNNIKFMKISRRKFRKKGKILNENSEIKIKLVTNIN